MSSKGSIKLFTIGYTSSASASFYKHYPIKQKYIQEQSTSTPTFPQSYLLYSSQKYWFPFVDLEQADESYIEYEDGDEFTFSEKDFIRQRKNVSNPNKGTADNYSAGLRIVYNNEVYESLDATFRWSDTQFDDSQNPYNTDSITKWKQTSDTSSEWTQYWYHPFLKSFFVLESKEIIQSLPDSNGFQQNKWDTFTGDSRNINLNNFTQSQILELNGLGLSKLSASTVIKNADSQILNSISGDSTVQPESGDISQRVKYSSGFSNSPTTVTVNRKTAGSKGELLTSSTSIDQPQIVQYYKLTDGSISPNPARFVFDYRPNNVQYSNIGSEWTEIPRPNNSPLIDFKGFRLMKITFEFLIGDKSDPFTSCDEKIRNLRIISTRPEPVIFLGFDSMFSEHLSYPEFSSGAGVLFAIADVSISSAQRVRIDTGNQNTQITSGKINRATVNMTLQELPIETPILTVLPRIGKEPVVPIAPPGPPGEDPCKTLFLNNKAISETPSLRRLYKVVDGVCLGNQK